MDESARTIALQAGLIGNSPQTRSAANLRPEMWVQRTLDA
jgi:hypothetical protein